MKRKIVIPILLVAAVLIGAGVLWSMRANRADPNRLHVFGNIELTEADLSFKVPGRLVALTVAEGDFVHKGQVVARLDQDQTLEQKRLNEAQVTSAQSQLQQGQTAVELQRATLRDEVAARRADLAQAQAHLAEMLAGSRPQEIEQAAAAVADARTQAQLAKDDLNRADQLMKTDDISRAQYEQYRTRHNSAVAQLQQAEKRLDLVKEGPRTEDIDQARAGVARAEAALKLSESNQLELRRKQEDLTARRAQIEQARAQLGITDVQLSDMVLRSPIDGVVLVKSAELGEVLAAGTTVVTVGDIDHPWVRAYINEPDLPRVHIGENAVVHTDGGRSFQGRVSFISSQAEFTPRQIQTPEERVKLVYRIKIDTENPGRALKSNMPVDATLALSQ
ncbi:MAG TPA: HlyD family efflux transporter periplasmic adaptor subunit [Bryobacteraceae bacterium]|nr:HlyD family efflux transporter periplasmic adaptor subunit [Bryobacteraceae bacterium]